MNISLMLLLIVKYYLIKVYPNFSVYFIVGLRTNQRLYPILGRGEAALVATVAEQEPG